VSDLLKKIRKLLPVIAVMLLITALFLANARGSLQWTFIKQVENKLYDLRTVLTMSGQLDDRIVIIDRE
jgi:hypothetical protein